MPSALCKKSGAQELRPDWKSHSTRGYSAACLWSFVLRTLGLGLNQTQSPLWTWLLQKLVLDVMSDLRYNLAASRRKTDFAYAQYGRMWFQNLSPQALK